MSLTEQPAAQYYTLNVELDPVRHWIACTVTIQNPPEACFYLHKNFEIRQILADGKPVSFHYDPSQTLVTPGDQAVMIEGQPLKELQVDYAGYLLAGALPPMCEVISAIREDLVELALYATWYPRFKNGGGIEFTLDVDLPAGCLTVTNGRMVQQELIHNSAGVEVNHSRWVSTRRGFDIVLLAAPQLKKIEISPVEIYYDQLPVDYVQQMCVGLNTCMQRFAEFYGPLPEKTFVRLVYSPREGWGYARSPAIVVSEAYALAKLPVPFGPAHDFQYAAHELSHFWWGIASMNTPDDWINEGLAEFSSFRMAEEVYGAAYADQRKTEYYQRLAACQTQTPIAETSSDSVDREPNRYDKMALLFIAAQQRFGQANLDRFLSSLYRRFSASHDATTASFLDELEQQVGTEAKCYFSQFLLNPGWDDALIARL